MRKITVAAITVAAIVGIIGIVLLAYGGQIFGAHAKAYVARHTVNAKTQQQVFDPNNRIQAQEWFAAQAQDIQGFEQNIKIQREAYKADPSPFNQVNLTGLRQECVNAVEDYNGNANKITQAQWRDPSLPYQLDPSAC